MTTTREQLEAVVERAGAIGEDATRIVAAGRQAIAQLDATDAPEPPDTRPVLRLAGATAIGVDDTRASEPDRGSYGSDLARSLGRRFCDATGLPFVAQVHPGRAIDAMKTRESAAMRVLSQTLGSLEVDARAAYAHAGTIGAGGDRPDGYYLDELVVSAASVAPHVAFAMRAMGMAAGAVDEAQRSLGAVRLMHAAGAAIAQLGPTLVSLGGGGDLTGWPEARLLDALGHAERFAAMHRLSLPALARQDYVFLGDLGRALDNSRRWGELAAAGFPGSGMVRSFCPLHAAKFTPMDDGSTLRGPRVFEAWHALAPATPVHFFVKVYASRFDDLVAATRESLAAFRLAPALGLPAPTDPTDPTDPTGSAA